MISIDSKNKTFKLDTPNTSYVIGVVDFDQLVNLYYGDKIADTEGLEARSFRPRCASFSPLTSEYSTDAHDFSPDCAPMEYGCNGCGDFRTSALSIRNADGNTVTDMRYEGYRIYAGKPSIDPLPAVYLNSESEADTLEIDMADKVTGMRVTLIYTAFNSLNVIIRSARIENASQRPADIDRAMSMCVDLPSMDYDLITLYGRHCKERSEERRPLAHGLQGIASKRGVSSHCQNPFAALVSKNAGEDSGEAYGFNLVYSGNFEFCTECDYSGTSRILMGINPTDFTWHLEPGESFQTPEAVMVHTSKGIGEMSRIYHKLYNFNLVTGKYRTEKRPLLINSWEAAFFDFDTDKLVSFAERAKEFGMDMLVMDDGWFGKRNNDQNSLGDWFVNESKLKGGLGELIDRVNALGLQFGIWYEPEMISPDSDLYREHPEWAIQIPGREATEIRCQYVLDLSRPEVQDYAYECVAKILRSANIKYVKWDMNRQLSDLGSTYLDKDSQQELFHRYVLGMYAMQERLIQEFPDLLLENCSGGGARFDPGMLYYSPQIWCSDDTDAIERLEIQEGTALIYPLCSMGAHVSVCPNHTVGRVTPFTTRGHVALAGTFGYELDITKLPEEERKLIPEQTAMYHKYHELIREGEYYRILSSRENHRSDCWAVASEDKSEVLVTYVQVLAQANMPSRKVRLRGFDPAKKYRLEGTDEVYSGEMLMNAGFRMKDFWGDFVSRLYHFVAVD